MIKTGKVKIVHIGLIGLGTVGGGVVKVLKSHARAIERKTGIRLVLKRVCVRSLAKKRAVKVSRSLLTTRVRDILDDPEIDIVVELAGGIHPAKEIIRDAYRNGKHVVTANKALLAETGNFVYDCARQAGRKLGYEASVCGGIPVIKSLKEGLAANQITSFMGIVNGTCNFILTEMTRRNRDFKVALRQAQAKGYAEANPRLDVEGVDAAHKLAILARLSFLSQIPMDGIYVEGISRLSLVDIRYAEELGYTVKLLAIGKRSPAGLELRVHPTMISADHPLASVRGVYNALYMHGDLVDDILFYGRGAGMMPTASAVMSDIIDIAKRITGEKDMRATAPIRPGRTRVLNMGQIRSKYYLRFQVADRMGVLGRIAQSLGRHGISILSVHQKEAHARGSVPVVILTYEAFEADLRKALKEIDASKDVRQKTVLIRVEK